MFKVKSKEFDYLLDEYDFKLCAKYIFLIHELADPFIKKILLLFVQDRKKFLSDKIGWIEEQGSRSNSEQFKYYYEILEYMENELQEEIYNLESNDKVVIIGRQLNKYWDDKDIGIEYLKEKSYFTTCDLIKIEQGDYKILDSCDIDHLIKISEISSLSELLQYGN